MTSTTAGKTNEKLGEMFSRFSFAAQLISDEGAQLVSEEMYSFLLSEHYTLQHKTSRPRRITANVVDAADVTVNETEALVALPPDDTPVTRLEENAKDRAREWRRLPAQMDWKYS